MEYTVQPGQTLTSIARDNNTTPQAIAEANGIVDVNKISVGQILSVPDAPIEEEPGIVPANNNISDEDLLIEKALEQKEQPVEDYSEGKYTAPGIDVSLEGGGDLDTTERDFTRGIVTETDYGTSKVDITNINQDVPSSEASQFAEGGVTEGGVTLAPKPEVVEVKPTIEEPAIPEGSPATTVSATNLDKVEPPGKDIPPTESELVKLIESLRPVSKPAADVFDGVIENIQNIEHESTFDAKEFYREISEEAERETKKIDASIAEIAEEKIKPTFSGWNKFLAVLGAAMGAYGSSMTGTPNYALQVINRAIDADQEQFLASKEIRTKSLLQQRLAVIQRKADLLQMGINEADRMLQVAELQIGKQESIANVRAIKEGLEQAKEKEITEYKLKVIDMLSEKVAAKRIADLAQSKDFRERGIEPVTLKDGKGNLIEMPGFLAKTKEEGAELRKTSGFGNQIQDVLNQLDALSDETNKLPKSALLPKFVSEVRTKVRALANELIIKLKEFYGMGANFTEYEQELIKALTPTDDWLEKWGMWKVKSNNLRDTIVRTHRSMAAAQGAKFAQTPNAAGKKKLGPGMKTGVSK